MTDKPRMVEVTDEGERNSLLNSWLAGDLSSPGILNSASGVIWADADELRAWRAARTQAISTVESTKGE